MKSAARWLAIGLFMSLTACSTRSANTEMTSCTYPDSPRTPAPEFICNATLPGYPITVLRVSNEQDSSVSERIDAVLQTQIQQWTQIWSLKWFSNTSDQTKALGFLLEKLSEQARVVRSRMSPRSQLWLLIGLPMTLDALEAETRDAVQGL